ncbi:hypothetical protein BN2475_710044 [Paraburkholderia ribeironis]|uniref:Uncharacterized protein n=1 Tax=Paraburkholderia ribeironis TaxID=1247936 RepID=A0A1N7SI60_9BURK|nr:hypothetical protein BN2475_710044 [Paraburkholderia ribeironis]
MFAGNPSMTIAGKPLALLPCLFYALGRLHETPCVIQAVDAGQRTTHRYVIKPAAGQSRRAWLDSASQCQPKCSSVSG